MTLQDLIDFVNQPLLNRVSRDSEVYIMDVTGACCKLASMHVAAETLFGTVEVRASIVRNEVQK